MDDATRFSTQPPATLLRAGAAGGKTGWLVDRAREALRSGLPPARVLCLALESAGAQGLERRFLEAAPEGAVPLPQVLTYDQVARQILSEAHGDPAERFLDPLAERLLVSRALEETAGQARRFRAAPLRESDRFRDDVADFIAELKRHKLTPEDFRDRVLPGLPEGPALEDLADVYQRYQQSLREAGLFDLRGLLWLALMALEKPAPAAAWRRRFSLVLADDLQDATPLHLELLAALVGPETELAATYEPSEAIYRFRGAVGDPAGWLGRLLPERRVEAVEAARCGGLPGAIREVAERFAGRYGLGASQKLPFPSHAEASPPAPSPAHGAWACGRGGSEGSTGETPGPPGEGPVPPGGVCYALYRSREEELEGLGDALVEALAGGCAPEEIAVLTRSAAEAQAAGEYLARRGLPAARMAGAGAAGAPGAWQAGRLLADLLTVLPQAAARPRPPGADLAARQAAGDALCRLADLIAAPAEQLLLPGLCRKADNLLTAPLPETCPALAALREEVRADRGETPAAALLRLARWLLGRAPAERRERLLGPLAALTGQVGRVAEQLQRLTGAAPSAEEIRAVLAEAQVPAPFPAPAIAVLTAHQTRGRHFPLVFLLSLQEETFPAPVVISRLLAPETAARLREKVRRLLELPEGVLSFAGLGEAPRDAEQEEQRLFYVCLTRSSERLVLSAHLEAGGAPVTPSPYLAASLPADFLLEEGAAGDRDFTCAFAGLAPEGTGGRASHEGCPVRPCPLGEARSQREPAEVEVSPRSAALVPVLREAAAGLTLFPSGLKEYLRCPRRFFLKELLKLVPEEEADVATYGTAIHDFLRQLNHRSPEGRGAEEAGRLLQAALEQARPDFSSALAADLYGRLAQAALKIYLTTDLATRKTTLPERYMFFDLSDNLGGRHRFGGKIDVVAELEEGVAVVDYKTGEIASAAALRRDLPLSEEEARAGAAEVQLPMYALAWEAQASGRAVRRVCLQNFSAARGCKASCLAVGPGEKEAETLTRADLERFRALLVQWAGEIKARTDFGGAAPEEGCRPYQGGCPFVGICDEAELG